MGRRYNVVIKAIIGDNVICLYHGRNDIGRKGSNKKEHAGGL